MIHSPDASEQTAVRRSQNLFSLWDGCAEDMRKVMSKVPHYPNFASWVGEFSAWLIELVDKDVDVALYHSVRQETQHLYYYGYNHSIHTAVLSLLLARRLRWTEDRSMCLVKAALTMNMPILELQGKMAEQEEPIRESQRILIQEHPQQSVEWLTLSGVADADWLGTVAEHHERPDGSGYPMGKSEVCEAAVALRVADVFLAKISPRKVRAPLPIQEAAKQLFREDHGGALSTAVIKEFGIFPPGEVVKLASGETGVVVRRTNNVKCPIVAVIRDASAKPTVSTPQRDTSKPEHAIVGTVADKSVVARMPPERLYGYAAVPSPAALKTP